VSLVEQVEERRIRRPALEVQTQRLVQCFPVALGESLQIAAAHEGTADPRQGLQFYGIVKEYAPRADPAPVEPPRACRTGF